jgi:hypothetical protein
VCGTSVMVRHPCPGKYEQGSPPAQFEMIFKVMASCNRFDAHPQSRSCRSNVSITGSLR